MPKPKMYMLTRGQSRPCTHNAIRIIQRPGSLLDLRQQVQISFVPGKAVEVPGDLDLSAVVASGFLVEIKPRGTKAVVKVKDSRPKLSQLLNLQPKPVEPVPEKPVEVEPEKLVVEPEKPVEVEPEKSVVEPEKPVVEPEIAEEADDDADYEETADGRFRCLRCQAEGVKKILKTENRMTAHIRAKH